jgi:DNA polymerase I-like protein with 3'-5' exonuclease and polymerase domains
VLDVETTTSNKGNPYDQRNRLVCVSWAYNSGDGVKSGAARYTDNLIPALQKLVDAADLVIGFNFKFDYHWLRKVGLNLENSRLWDVQVAEFVLEHQRNAYPSLEQTAIKYGLGNKIDVIKLEYWDKGIDTDQDAVLTLGAYEAQLPQVLPAQMKLLGLMNADLHILAEMEKNGITYDETLCATRGDELQVKIDDLRSKLDNFYPDIPINWGSPDQLSAFLYGGNIKQEVKEHIGFFKTGKQVGQPRYRNKEVVHTLPRLYAPLKGSELAKEGMYSTSEDTLLKLKGNKGPLKMLLELSKLEKLSGTYYRGLPKLNAEMHWPEGYLHGNFNQCVAQTGRLSSTKPNLQNFASELQDVFITRF